jgi:drug/metabolite transporter (DMT)-like permease
MHELAGEAAALTAAALWASAVVWFRPAIARHGAQVVNLLKGLVATALLAVTAAFTGGFHALAVAPATALGWMGASAIAGLTLGDTALFAAVRRTGAHTALLLQTLAPVFTAALALPAGERLAAGEWLGAAVVLAGVAMVVGPGARGPQAAPAAHRAAWRAGLAFGVLAAFGQGAGVALAKPALDVLAVLPATLLRLAVGSAGLAIVGIRSGLVRRTVTALADPVTRRTAVPASVLGTYLSMLLMMASIAWAPATIASVLLSTSPVMGMVVEAVVDRRRPAAVAVVGTFVAVAGVALLTASG